MIIGKRNSFGMRRLVAGMLVVYATLASAGKLPTCANSCIIPTVCTKRDFCSTSCFGNCLVDLGPGMDERCSSAMNQQLLIKHCEGKFEPKEEIPQTPVEDVGRYEPAAVVPTPAGERLASSAQEELEQSSSTDRATLSEVPVARKAASKSQAPPSDEEDEELYEEEETGRATGRPGQSMLVSSLAVAAAGLFTSAVYLL